MKSNYSNSRAFAQRMDLEDPLRRYREQFHHPVHQDGSPQIYLCGNSLGLQPKTTALHIQQVLADWQKLGVEGHFHANNPWLPYHEFLTEAMARVVGGKPDEVVVMNTLTVNLHLMMISFYRPTPTRYKIMIESDAFPSDRYAATSQIQLHGFDPTDALVLLSPREGEVLLREEDIKARIEAEGDSLALVLLGNTNYYTGQYFDMKAISKWGHSAGAHVGFDCAHGAGNQDLQLHDSGCDFAVWCNYKYLNSGPGGLGGAFIHERHLTNTAIHRLEGWWGHNKKTRFLMRDDFDPIPTAEAWQLSNPPILAMGAVWASLKIFDEVGMTALRKKADHLTGYLEYLVNSLGEDVINMITPSDPSMRGSQLSIQVKDANSSIFRQITEAGVIADWREPDVIRVAPTALYNSYEDVYRFYKILQSTIQSI